MTRKLGGYDEEVGGVSPRKPA